MRRSARQVEIPSTYDSATRLAIDPKNVRPPRQVTMTRSAQSHAFHLAKIARLMRRAALLAVYFAVMLTIRYAGWLMNDYVFFLNPARAVYSGTLDIYAQRLHPEVAPPYGIGYAYPPLVAIVTAPAVWLGDTLRLSDDATGRYLYVIPLLLFDVLCLFAFGRLLRQILPSISEREEIACLVLAMAIPGFASAAAYSSHAETLMCFLLLAGVAAFLEGRAMAAGAILGLALSTKQTALFVLVPLVFLSLKQAVERRDYRNVMRFCLSTTVVFAAVCLPFAVANFGAMKYALVDAQRALVVSGESVWLLVREVLGHDLAIRAVAPWVLLGAMIATSFFLVMRNRIRSNVDVLGLLVVSPLLIDVLSKYTGVYYKLPAFFFLILWDRTRRRSGGVPWIAITYIAIFSLLDSLPLGVHPASFEMREQVVRAAIKVPLYIGLFVHLLRSIPEEDIGPIQMTGASRPICGS